MLGLLCDCRQRVRGRPGRYKALREALHELELSFVFDSPRAKKASKYAENTTTCPNLVACMLAIANQTFRYELKRVVCRQDESDPFIVNRSFRDGNDPILPAGSKCAGRARHDIAVKENWKKVAASHLQLIPSADFKRLQEAIPEGTSLFIDDIRVREHSASSRIFEEGVLDRGQLIVPPQVVLIAEDDDVCLALKNPALKVTQITHIEIGRAHV